VRGFRVICATLVAACVLAAPARASSLTLQVVSPDTLRVIAPDDRPAYLLIARTASGVGIMSGGVAGVVDAPVFTPSELPAPCSTRW
jgi:hypothetical protein